MKKIKPIWYNLLIWHYETEKTAGVYMDYSRGYLDLEGAKWTIEYYQDKINRIKEKLRK